jgi:hypothetical protein
MMRHGRHYKKREIQTPHPNPDNRFRTTVRDP